MLDVSKIEFKPTQNYLTFEVCCTDADDEAPPVAEEEAGGKLFCRTL